jgi:hypothetical protein
VQIHGPIKQPAQLLLHPEEPESRRPSGLELDQHVDVAARAEVVAQCGPENGEPTNAVLSAELGQSILIDRHLRIQSTTCRRTLT